MMSVAVNAIAKPSQPERQGDVNDSETFQVEVGSGPLGHAHVETPEVQEKRKQKPGLHEESTPGPQSRRLVAERCLMCNHDQLEEGQVQSTGRVAFKPLKTKFWIWEESSVKVSARMCTRCGYIHMFADTDKLSRLQPESNE